MSKKRTLATEEEHLEEYLTKYYIRIFTLTAFLLLAVWMLLSPEKPEHSYVEKVTVSLFKDLWGIPFALVILTFALPIFGYTIYKIWQFRKFTWRKLSNGYYLFENRIRLSGLASMLDGNDMIVFHPEKKQVLKFKNYKKAKLDNYGSVKITREFDNDMIYWNADDDGYCVTFKGESMTGMASETKGQDLYVKLPEKHLTLYLKNYWNLKDGRIRQARIA